VTAETVADRRVHPATIVLRFLKEAPSTVLALPAGLAFLSRTGLVQALGFAILLALILVFFNWLAWTRFRYGVGERDIVIESGILHCTRRVIPFDRIQDVDLERALLHRAFGLAKVKIETGAGGKDEGLLDSVSLVEAERLRASVRAWQGAAPAGAQAADAAAAPAAAALFEMGVPRVLLFGLFNFSLVYLAGLFALLQSFDQLLPFDIYDPARWVGLVDEHLPERFTFGAIAAVLFAALLLGLVAGVLRTLARDHGYRLSSEGERFRRERGLLTRSEVVIARRRVQLAHVETGPIRRWLGWFGLSFQTLGASGDGSGHQPAAPFARREEMERVLAETRGLRLPPPPVLAMVSRRHILRALLLGIGPSLAAILAASVWWRPALALVALLPLLGVVAWLDRYFHRYALDGELLFVERGFWRQQLWLIPLANLQALSLGRSWLQRRLGLATLSLDTAGAPAMNPPRIVDLRLEAARALAREISARRPHSSGRKSGTDK
jgi:putative membrane protein